MTMRRVNQITAVVILIPSVYLEWSAFDLHYYTHMGPGPGFFPVWLAAILCVLAIVMFLTATFGRPAGEVPEASVAFLPDREGRLRIAIVTLMLGGCAFLLERIGFGLAMFVMNATVLWTLGVRSIPRYSPFRSPAASASNTCSPRG